jgi:predicted Zn-dependent peptidase
MEAACAPRKAPLVLAELLRLLAELCDENVAEDELLRAKVRHGIGLEFALDSAGEMIGWFGGTELFRPAEGFAERAARIEAVTAADIRTVARKVLRRDGLVVCAVGPLTAVEKRLQSGVDDAQGLPR